MKTRELKNSSRYVIRIYEFAELESTNLTAKEMAQNGAEEFTVVNALAQTGGRGRNSRRWESPAGLGLWLSVILRPDISMQKIGLLNLMTALCVREYLEAVSARISGLSPQVFSLKWPNDVWLNGKKICGILLQAGSSAKRLDYVVAGIGINVNQGVKDFPPEIRQTATSLRLATGVKFNLSLLLDDFLVLYAHRLSRTIESRFSSVRDEYLRHMLFRGEEVTVELLQNSITGTVKGIDENGYLLLNTAAGEQMVSAGDIYKLN